ncbi:MAG: hypothetical protein H6677_02540 [Candidatus Obscuribacterales bacterium]|nr:hypothetical protein [Candidatus Obscuribacterales bacterium]
MAGQHNFDANVNNRGSEADTVSANSGAQASANLFNEYRSMMDSGSKSFAPPSDYERGVKGAPNPNDKFAKLTHNDNFQPVDRGPLEKPDANQDGTREQNQEPVDRGPIEKPGSETEGRHNEGFEPVDRGPMETEPAENEHRETNNGNFKPVDRGPLNDSEGNGDKNAIDHQEKVISENEDIPQSSGGQGGMTNDSRDPIIKWFGSVQIFDSKAGGDPI